MYFEDFITGNSVLTPERKITTDDLDAFIDISGLNLPMFMRDEDARKVGHPHRLIPGPMILSVAMGLVKETGWFDRIVAVVAFDELRFLKALHPGRSIRAEITVAFTRLTKNPRRGLVALAYNVINQDKVAIFSTLGKYLMQRRRPD